MSEVLVVLIAAVIMDRLLGEPPALLHSTVWMGRITALLKRRGSRLYGAMILLAVAMPFSVLAYAIASAGNFVVAALVLKLQFAWRSLAEHASAVSQSLRKDLDMGRRAVSRIVGRDTRELDHRHVISAAVESIGESSVDGIIAPLFYYLVAGILFGLPAGIAAAVFYRAVNTLDSEIGHRSEEYRQVGYFSARLDDVLNCVPARMTAALLMLSALVLREDWRGAVRIFLRDRRNTASPNSGQPMAAVAGALGVQLEKIGFHRLGDSRDELDLAHLSRAMRLVDLTAISFLVISALILVGS